MSAEKHAALIVELGNKIINIQEKIMELKRYKDQDQLPELKRAAGEINRELKEGLEIYQSKKAELKKDEVHDLFHVRQMKITNIFLTGTEKMMKLGDHDYAGLDRILEWMWEEQKKLVV
ncbi:hypothetical protein [Salinicoccus roseus]|uniref:hypothetical protein n=1 Tax=Salinicoccus roseus TaxID=45670 RepID=UPI003DA05B81